MKFDKDFITEIIKDLKDLGKKIYLDSPDMWIDFEDRISDNNLDEMVLFFATKYNYLSIVKSAVENGMVDLDAPSKKPGFKTIKDHLLKASIEFNSKDIYDFLLNYKKADQNNSSNDKNAYKDNINSYDFENILKTVESTLSSFCNDIDIDKIPNPMKNTKVNAKDIFKDGETIFSSFTEGLFDNDDTKHVKQESSCYEPKFICPNCNCNILENGYSCIQKINYKYSKEEKKVKSTSTEQVDSVICSTCNYTIDQLSPDFLENLCTIQNCKKCGKDLTSTGIVTKTKTEYDRESNTFVSSIKSYHCAECDSELTDYQVNYFRL